MIIEAKKYDEWGQYWDQWKKEVKAYYNEYRQDKKVVFLVAFGGNEELKERYVWVEDRRVMIYKCNWLSIQYAVSEYRRTLFSKDLRNCDYNSVKRILDQVLLAFELNGMKSVAWLEDLEQKGQYISDRSIEVLNNFMNLKGYGRYR